MAKKKTIKTKAAKKKRISKKAPKAKKKAAPSLNGSNGKVDHRRSEVQQIVKNACDQLNSEGVDARNYVEQLAWLFFLKAFDEAESRREGEAAFDDTPFERRLSGEYAWSSWASKTEYPDEMLEFVDDKLWIKLTSPDPEKGLGDDALADRFRRVFDNVRNYCRRGASFARVVAQVNKLHFSNDTDVHVLSEIYEDLLKRVAADSAGYAGEFYTQRHIIRAMVEVVKPQVGEKVYDPCFGTCGFLGEAADFMTDSDRNPKARNLSRTELDRLQSGTFFGLEIKPLTYLLGTMNMILHGIESANLELANTLEVHDQNVAEKNRYDVILSNPPYGGKMASELQTNFRVKSSATESLFLQHIMTNLARGGRAAVIVPEGVLYRGGPDEKVRKELLEQFDVHTVLSLPTGCFLPYTTVKTNVVFFDRPKADLDVGQTATKSVWFYELSNDGFELKQTRKPIDGTQLPDFLLKQGAKEESENSWSVAVEQIIERGHDLSAKNPNTIYSFDRGPSIEHVSRLRKSQTTTLRLIDDLADLVGNGRQSLSVDDYSEQTVEELLKEKPANGIFKKKKDFGQGVLLVNVKDLYSSDVVQVDQLDRVRATQTEVERYLLKPGDVLVNRSSLKREGTGRSCLFLGADEPVIFECHIMRARLNAAKLLPHLFVAFMNSPMGLSRILMRAKTATMTTWNQRDLQSLPVPVPQKAKQKALLKRLIRINEIIEEIESNNLTEDLEHFRASVLHRIFTGEL